MCWNFIVFNVRISASKKRNIFFSCIESLALYSCHIVERCDDSCDVIVVKVKNILKSIIN